MPAPSSPLLAHLWLALHAPLAARGFHVYVSIAGPQDGRWPSVVSEFGGGCLSSPLLLPPRAWEEAWQETFGRS